LIEYLVPDSGPILEFDGSLNGSVVVVDDDGAYHLCPLDIRNAQREAVNDVAAYQLDDLRRCRKTYVRLQRRILDRSERHLMIEIITLKNEPNQDSLNRRQTIVKKSLWNNLRNLKSYLTIMNSRFLKFPLFPLN